MSNELLSPPTPAIAPPKHYLLTTAIFCHVCGVPVRADDYALAVGIGEAELQSQRHQIHHWCPQWSSASRTKEASEGWLIKI